MLSALAHAYLGGGKRCLWCIVARRRQPGIRHCVHCADTAAMFFRMMYNYTPARDAELLTWEATQGE